MEKLTYNEKRIKINELHALITNQYIIKEKIKELAAIFTVEELKEIKFHSTYETQPIIEKLIQ